MADMIEEAVDLLAEELTANLSHTVTYKRGTESVELPATIGRTQGELQEIDGSAQIEWHDRDYLILASNLILGGVHVEPRIGDRIEEVQDGVTYVHEALVRFGDKVWRWSDPNRKIMRIHTKEIRSQS